MQDDALLCGCGPCRQSALGALRSDIARDEMRLRNEELKFRIFERGLEDLEGDDRSDAEQQLRSIRAWIDTLTDRLTVNRTLEGWLTFNERHMPRDADEALWRYIVDRPNGRF